MSTMPLTLFGELDDQAVEQLAEMLAPRLSTRLKSEAIQGPRRATVLTRDKRRFEADVAIDGKWVHLTRVVEVHGGSQRHNLIQRDDRSLKETAVAEIRWWPT